MGLSHNHSLASEEAEEDYTVPDEYGNLDEIAGPSPVENPDEQRFYRHESLEQSRSNSRVDQQRPQRHDSVEERRFRGRNGLEERQGSWANRRASGIDEQGDENLAEFTAPPPVDPGQHAYPSAGDSPSTSVGKAEETESKHQRSPRRERASKLATKLYICSYLIFFSILGTLARLGLQALTFYPSAPVQTSVLWANFAGSLLMGFLSEDRKLFQEEWGPGDKAKREDEEQGTRSEEEKEAEKDAEAAKKKHGTVKKTIPLYIGLATGFCGSFTSFSSFIRDVFFALSNSLQVPVSQTSSAPIDMSSIVSRSGGYDFMALFAVIILTVTLCLGGLQCGAHLAIALEPITPSIPFYLGRKFIDRITVVLAFGMWLGAVFLSIWPPDRPGGSTGAHASWNEETWRGEVIYALVFAPLGCLLRFYLSLRLNGRIASFPLGTFAVNIFGTAMLGVFYVLQHTPLNRTTVGLVGGGLVGCQVLQGWMDGFCGCVTTVSTWVSELKGLRRRHAYVYGAASVAVALGLLVIIMGSLKWSVGFSAPACVT
ncbi:hypothetical protein MMC34_000286 [Xylographa carneopallida]|nr:hypothetical protein [Xylographa carneopallida]